MESKNSWKSSLKSAKHKKKKFYLLKKNGNLQRVGSGASCLLSWDHLSKFNRKKELKNKKCKMIIWLSFSGGGSYYYFDLTVIGLNFLLYRFRVCYQRILWSIVRRIHCFKIKALLFSLIIIEDINDIV